MRLMLKETIVKTFIIFSKIIHLAIYWVFWSVIIHMIIWVVSYSKKNLGEL